MGFCSSQAKKFLADLNPAYMTAKSSLRDLRKHVSVLFPPTPSSSSSRATLYLPTKQTFSNSERSLVNAWKAYLKWEENDEVMVEDKAVHFQRMQGIYRKAVVRMRFHSQIW